MVSAEHLEVLRDAIGDDGVDEHDPIALEGVEGVAPALTLLPADGTALSKVLAALGRCGLAILIRGGGNRIRVGNSPSRIDAWLSTRRLVGIEEFDADEGVCKVGSGTALSAVRSVVNARGWELPLDPPGGNATVGGVIAAGAAGPRALGFGPTRDLVLGLEVCLASGQRTRCGGRVVKNVTGYDLNKAYTGSYGTLGVIESAWLRLSPLPEHTACCEVHFADIAAACRLGIEAARRYSARAVAIASSADASQPWRCVAELAGDAPSVNRDVAWLRDDHGASDSPPGGIDQIREIQAATPSAAGLRFRVAVLPSRLEAVMASLHGMGASLLVYPGLRLVYADFGAAGEAGDIFRGVAEVADRAGGDYLCESAPGWAKRGRDVFAARAGSVSLMAALKNRFDPGGVLNPGRFAGGI